jgi:hypothetical protein
MKEKREFSQPFLGPMARLLHETCVVSAWTGRTKIVAGTCHRFEFETNGLNEGTPLEIWICAADLLAILPGFSPLTSNRPHLMQASFAALYPAEKTCLNRKWTPMNANPDQARLIFILQNSLKKGAIWGVPFGFL